MIRSKPVSTVMLWLKRKVREVIHQEKAQLDKYYREYESDREDMEVAGSIQ